MNMEFCPECGKLLIPKTKGNTKKLVCPKCGYETTLKSDSEYEVEDEVKHKSTEKLEVIEVEDSENVFTEDPEERRERFVESIDLFETE